MPPADTGDYRQWHLPLCHDNMTLAEARNDLAAVGAGSEQIPLMVQLVENPKYRIPGLDLFHGRVSLYEHDAIHILLGRGLLNKDEAFTIGFTMGSTRQVSGLEEDLFAKIARHLYPGPYRFTDADIAVFRDAVRLGYLCGCEPLDRVDFAPLEPLSLQTLRNRLGIDRGLLLAYYRIEQRRYPHDPASQRLLAGCE